MRLPIQASLVCIAASCLCGSALAQQAPAARALGPITSVSSESFASVTAAVMVSGGVFVNDISAHRLVLLDSLLEHQKVISDSATGYGTLPGTLLPFHGDSALLITPSSLSMLVLTRAGAVARVMAMPSANSGPFLLGSIFGTPGFDAHGRLVYYLQAQGAFGPQRETGATVMESPDSAFVQRFDFSTRTFDTVAAFRIVNSRSTMHRFDDGHMEVDIVAFPPCIVDDWAVASDGSIAVLRGATITWIG